MPTGIVRGVSFVFLSQIVRIIAKGGVMLLLTRYLLTPSEFGLLSLTLSTLAFAMLFANLGISKAGARYITEYRETAPDLVSLVIRRTLFYNSIAIVVVSVVVFLWHDTIAAVVDEPGIGVLLLLGIGYVVGKSITGTVIIFFQGLNRMDWTAYIGIVSNSVLLIAVPSLVVLGFGLEGAVFGYVLSSGIAAVVGLAILFRRFHDRSSTTDDTKRDVSRKILRYSLPLSFTQGANVINNRADTILLSVFRGPTSIALYTLGKQIADFLVTPAQSLGFGISPSFAEQKANEQQAEAAALYEQSFIYTIAIYTPAAAGVVLVANPAVTLIFGSSYAGTGPVLQIFSVFVFIRSLDAITSDALDYLGRANARATAKGTLTVANVVCNLLLIPPFGVFGATIATVVTYALYVGTELYIISDELPIDIQRLARTGLVVGAITFGMSVVLYPLTDFVSDLPSLAGVICLGGAIWAVLTVLSGVVDPRQLYATLS